jgi:hypothetical protein
MPPRLRHTTDDVDVPSAAPVPAVARVRAASASASASSTPAGAAHVPPPPPHEYVDRAVASVRGGAASFVRGVKSRGWLALNLAAALAALAVAVAACLRVVPPPPLPMVAELLIELPHVTLHAHAACDALRALVSTPPWLWTLPSLASWLHAIANFVSAAAALGFLGAVVLTLCEWDVLVRALSTVARTLARTALLSVAAFVLAFVHAAPPATPPSLMRDAVMAAAAAAVACGGWAPLAFLGETVARSLDGGSRARERAGCLLGVLYVAALAAPLAGALHTRMALLVGFVAVTAAFDALRYASCAASPEHARIFASATLAMLDVCLRELAPAAAPALLRPFALALWVCGTLALLGEVVRATAREVHSVRGLLAVVLSLALPAGAAWRWTRVPHVVLAMAAAASINLVYLSSKLAFRSGLVGLAAAVLLGPTAAAAWAVKTHAHAAASMCLHAWAVLTAA